MWYSWDCLGKSVCQARWILDGYELWWIGSSAAQWRSKDAPLGLIGCSVGADTTIGLGVAVATGRAVPANLKVVMHPDHMLRSVALKKR